LRLGSLYLGIQIGNLVVQRRIPPVARASESKSDEDQKDRHEIGRQSDLRAGFCFSAACSSEIDFNHRSNPLKAKPTATASAGPRDVTCSTSTLGPSVMDLNGSRTSVGYPKVSWIFSARPTMREVPPLIRTRLMVSDGYVSRKKSNVFWTS